MKRSDAALIVTSSIQAVTIFGALSKPNLFELRATKPTQAAMDDLEASLLVPAAFALALGAATSAITRSALPFVINAVIVAGMYLVLTGQLKTPAREEREGAA